MLCICIKYPLAPGDNPVAIKYYKQSRTGARGDFPACLWERNSQFISVPSEQVTKHFKEPQTWIDTWERRK